MTIRKANRSDIGGIMQIIEAARLFMRSYGNMTQWADGYPEESLMLSEIEAGHCLVVESGNRAVATFCLIVGNDPTYAEIDGAWLDDAPYAVIHRLASDQSVRGIAKACLDWSFSQCDNIRIDTHHDNIILQKLLKNYGFSYCGIIRLTNGDPRLAYQLHKP